MVSKNMLAVLVLVAIVLSLFGTFVILDIVTEEGTPVSEGVVRVNVMEEPGPPSSAAQIKLNVIEKGG